MNIKNILKKISIYNKFKYYILVLTLLLYIKGIYVIESQKKTKSIENSFSSKEINYKGEKILKSRLINEYLSRVSDDYKADKEEERIRFNKFIYLSDFSNNSFVQTELRTKFFEFVSKLKNQTITKLDTFFFSRNWYFGNSLNAVNNAIFYCEIIGCQKIILNKHNLKRKWLITNQIYIDKLNITIYQDTNITCKNNQILCIFEDSWDTFYPKIIFPQIRIHLIKKEILKNLPIVKIEPNSLYIHMRGGDIFKSSIFKFYSQPPLCFYEKIINNRKFKNIFIISMDNSNIIINALKKRHTNIIHNINNFEYDISLLCHAYNIVLSVSSFVLSAIKLNDNIKDIWEYDIMRLSEKFLFLHHHFFKLNIHYRIHTMKPSNIYASKMFSWKNTPEQIKLMLEDNCPYDFVITKPNL